MRSLLIVIIAFSLLNCDYTPHGDVYTQVPAPDLSDVTVSINYPTDTIYTYQNRPIKYTVAGKDMGAIKTWVILNSDTVYSSSSNTGGYTIDVKSLGTGKFPLRIYSEFQRETKSLAGVLGFERFYAYKDWTVDIDIDPPLPVQITSIIMVNGHPTITWQKYTRINFENYQLVKQCYNSPSDTEPSSNCKYLSISNQNTVSYEDTDYAGGKVGYIIGVLANNTFVTSDPVVYQP